jgi:cation transport ATPase
VLGLVALADRVKPTSRQAVAELRALGLTPVLLTGDNERTARAVAAEVGIERVVAQADLGLSIGTGTDIAIEACDLTLVFGDLRAAADAIALSRRTLATIKGNLFWAFAYNVVAVPLAIAGVCLIPRLWFSSTGALGLAPALISAVRPAGPGPGEARPLLAPGTPAARNLPALSC